MFVLNEILTPKKSHSLNIIITLSLQLYKIECLAKPFPITALLNQDTNESDHTGEVGLMLWMALVRLYRSGRSRIPA